MDDNRPPELPLQYKPKGCRDIGRPFGSWDTLEPKLLTTDHVSIYSFI
jgi:hypothetical protein